MKTLNIDLTTYNALLAWLEKSNPSGTNQKKTVKKKVSGTSTGPRLSAVVVQTPVKKVRHKFLLVPSISMDLSQLVGLFCALLL